MAEHTPGPWAVTAEGGYTGHGVSAGRKRICSINSNSTVLAAERTANGRLIAAAPDMYEALKELRTAFITAWGFEPDESSIHSAALKKAADALAKVQP